MGVNGILLVVETRCPTRMDMIKAAREKKKEKTVAALHELLCATFGAAELPDMISSAIQSQLME